MLTAENLDDLVSTTDAAREIGVATETIRSWAHRGHLEKAGLDEKGRPMYRLIDVVRAARDTRWRAIGRNRTA